MEGKYLGQKTSYPQQYNKDLLLPLLRYENRKQYGIPEHPEFLGFDTWHCYEFSFLTKKGFPVTGMLKIVYPSSNLLIVESKSLKLYLNSFNMDRFGENTEEGISEVMGIIKEDLSKSLDTEVQIGFFDDSKDAAFDFADYQKLEKEINPDRLSFDEFSENPNLLKVIDQKQELKIYSDVLRSNCKVTHQPDWGTVFVKLKSEMGIDLESLLKYLVSFRNENHFHEEVCEIIYQRLMDILKPEVLMVACIYTRRGGIDICPVRSNKTELLPKHLLDTRTFDQKLFRQ